MDMSDLVNGLKQKKKKKRSFCSCTIVVCLSYKEGKSGDAQGIYMDMFIWAMSGGMIWSVG